MVWACAEERLGYAWQKNKIKNPPGRQEDCRRFMDGAGTCCTPKTKSDWLFLISSPNILVHWKWQGVVKPSRNIGLRSKSFYRTAGDWVNMVTQICVLERWSAESFYRMRSKWTEDVQSVFCKSFCHSDWCFDWKCDVNDRTIYQLTPSKFCFVFVCFVFFLGKKVQKVKKKSKIIMLLPCNELTQNELFSKM